MVLSTHFALLIAARSTFGALLRPRFGLFQKVDSPNVGRCLFSKLHRAALPANFAPTRRALTKFADAEECEAGILGLPNVGWDMELEEPP